VCVKYYWRIIRHQQARAKVTTLKKINKEISTKSIMPNKCMKKKDQPKTLINIEQGIQSKIKVQESIKKVTSKEEKTRNQSKKTVNRENGAQQNEPLSMKENYSPSTAPLTWIPRIYVQELMQMKEKLDNIERREKLKDAKVVEVINNMQRMERENKVLKDEVSKL